MRYEVHKKEREQFLLINQTMRENRCTEKRVKDNAQIIAIASLLTVSWSILCAQTKRFQERCMCYNYVLQWLIIGE